MTSTHKMYGRLFKRVKGGWLAELSSVRCETVQVTLPDKKLFVTTQATPHKRVHIGKVARADSHELQEGTQVAVLVTGDLVQKLSAPDPYLRNTYGRYSGWHNESEYMSRDEDELSSQDPTVVRWGTGAMLRRATATAA